VPEGSERPEPGGHIECQKYGVDADDLASEISRGVVKQTAHSELRKLQASPTEPSLGNANPDGLEEAPRTESSPRGRSFPVMAIITSIQKT
jgi:hypothetical protein